MTSDFAHWREEPDDRELLRLDLVGLAAEVATLSTRIDEALRETLCPEVPDLSARCRSLSQRAASVLAREAKFDGISIGALRAALGILRED